MFFGLKEISDHPCCQMQEIVESFFRESIDRATFSPDLFPEWFRDTLGSSACTLDSKFKAVHKNLHATSSNKKLRQNIYDIVYDSNAIEEICKGEAEVSEDLVDWDCPLGKAISDLMECLYDGLDLSVFRRNRSGGAVKPRQELYKEFIITNKYVCPFCGIAKFKNRLGPRREDFDHYLNKSSYPLSAANMKNLVPTCSDCNQTYKRDKDVMEDGSAFYPYSEIPPMKVQLACSNYPASDTVVGNGKWDVEVALVSPHPELEVKVAAWERVYSIKERLRNEVAENFEDWMDELSDEDPEGLDEKGLRSLIKSARDKANKASLRRIQPSQIIRAAFYDFMLTKAERTFLLSFQCRLNGGITS